MSAHHAAVFRVNDPSYPDKLWRSSCPCGHFYRFAFWSNAIRDAYSHTHPPLFTPALKDAS